MKRQTSITLTDFTNFLQAGALLRHQGQWILTFGESRLIAGQELQESEDISVFCPEFYDVEDGSGVSFSQEAQITNHDFQLLCRNFLETGSPADTIEWKWQEPDLNDFSTAFTQTQQLISQGQIDKAVPCVFTRAQGSLSFNARAKMLLKLTEAPARLHVYGYWDGNGGILGATPEILFHKKGLNLSTMALAGTLPKSTQARGEQLLKDKKEIRENQLVVDDLKLQLSSLGRLQISGPQVLELPTLWHLLTEIELIMNEDTPVLSLVKRLHPTPALGVAPRRFGWRWMREWPGQEDRERFGAPFLMRVGPGEWMCLVAIRNLQWNKTEIRIGSGCGVVRESALEREWLELFYKRDSVKKIIGMKS